MGPCNQDLLVIYEDSEIVAINKPSGIHSAIVKGSEQPSVAQMLAARDEKMSAASLKPEDAGLVNRLDYETSGVLLAAKSKTIWLKFRENLEAKDARKTYLTILEGQAPQNQEVRNYIGSRHRHSKKVSIFQDLPAGGRALLAASSFELLEYWAEKNLSLVKVNLGSGRRHQIRAHAASIGCALLGDSLYGSTRQTNELAGDAPEFLLPGFLLHAESVEFRHPGNSKTLKITAPIPSIFELFSRTSA